MKVELCGHVPSVDTVLQGGLSVFKLKTARPSVKDLRPELSFPSVLMMLGACVLCVPARLCVLTVASAPWKVI